MSSSGQYPVASGGAERRWTKRWLERYWHPCRCGSTFPWHWHYGRCSALRTPITDERCCCEVLYGCDTLPPSTLRGRRRAA